MMKDDLWIKNGDDLWIPAPKFAITKCAHDGQSITVSFQDGLTICLTRQALGFSKGSGRFGGKILNVSVGASKIIIAVELDLDPHIHAITSVHFREIWENMTDDEKTDG